MELRAEYADRWGVLESALGRPSFHALFDHLLTIEHAAALAAPNSQADAAAVLLGSSSGSSWAHTPNRPGGYNTNSSSSSGTAAAEAMPGGPYIPPGCALAGTGGAWGSAPLPFEPHPVAPGARRTPELLPGLAERPAAQIQSLLERLLQYGEQLLLIRANDWSTLVAEGGSGE